MIPSAFENYGLYYIYKSAFDIIMTGGQNYVYRFYH